MQTLKNRKIFLAKQFFGSIHSRNVPPVNIFVSKAQTAPLPPDHPGYKYNLCREEDEEEEEDGGLRRKRTEEDRRTEEDED